MQATCPATATLRELSLGQLDEEQSDELLFHVEACNDCQSTLGQLDETEDTFIKSLQDDPAKLKDLADFQQEPEYQVAAAKALGALASASETELHFGSEMKAPKSIGEYDIIRPLGRGGMGHVYLGHHTKLGRPVAVKLLATHRRWDENMRQRFESEMRTVGGLSHPNIVVAHDAREIDGEAVLVTEYIDGLDLSEVMRRHKALDAGIACAIANKMVAALKYIDSQGLVHRDIKPSNTMISKTGEVKVLDLGLARLQSTGADGNEFTATGQAIGTADYIAPELINDGKAIDIRADVYSLGCTLYKLLCGRAPFSDDDHTSSFAKLNAHISETPPSLTQLIPNLPSALSQLIDAMLVKAPDQRPNLVEIETCLGRFASGSNILEFVNDTMALPTKAQPVAPVKTEPRPATKTGATNRSLIYAAIATGVVGFLLGLWLGITITIKKPDGSITKVTIPDGSHASVDDEGNVSIDLKGQKSDKKQVDSPLSAIDKWNSGNVVYARKEKSENRVFSDTQIPRDALAGFQVGDVVDIFCEGVSDDRAVSQISAVKVRISDLTKSDLPLWDFEFEALDDSIYANLMPTRIKKHDPKIWNDFNTEFLRGCWRTVAMDLGGGDSDWNDELLTVFHGNSVYSISSQSVSRADFAADKDTLKMTNVEKGVTIAGNPKFSFETQDKLTFIYEAGENRAEFSLERVRNPKTDLERETFERIRKADRPTVAMEFRIAKDKPENEKWVRMQVENGGKPVWVSPVTLASNRDLIDASVNKTGGGDEDVQRNSISLKFSSSAGRVIHNYTSNSRGHKVAILIDGKVVMAPEIVDAIGDSAAIHGSFTDEECNRIVDGILPVFELPNRED